MRLGFVAVLLTYAALYWASLAIIPKPLITYWASVKAIGLRPILNYQMFIIWLTSPEQSNNCLGCEAGSPHAWVHGQAPGWVGSR